MMRICKNPNVMWREEDDAMDCEREALDRGEAAGERGTSVLFSGGTMISLNILGTEIWKLADGRDLDGLVKDLLERFDVDEATLTADVSAFLEELAAKGFLSYERG